MKAVIYTKYGTPDVLQYTDVKKPEPNSKEVLVEIKATSINSWDWDMLTGRPKLYQLLSGIGKPKFTIPGINIAGIVQTVGKDVTRLKEGDEVYGDISGSNFGAFAEYTCANEKFLALKPQNASFEEAASMPHGGVLALQSLNLYPIVPNQKILINGAGGCAGPIGLQIAKIQGAEITCIDKSLKLEKLSSLGADHVIDYNKVDFTKSGKKYDLIVENIAQKSLSDYSRALNDNGKLLMVGGKMSLILKIALLGNLYNLGSGKKMKLMPHTPNSKDLDHLSELFDSGKLKAQIDSTFKLKDIQKAFLHYATGNAFGNIILCP